MSKLRPNAPDIEQYGYLLKQLAGAFRRRIDEQLRDRDLPLSNAQMTVLFVIEEEPGASGAELARRMLISAQAISTILRRLERGGYISRASDPANQRRRRWQLTRKAHNALARAKRAVRPIMARMLGDLTPA